jgi:hypothetical protein
MCTMKKYLIITFFYLVLILPVYGIERHLLLFGTLSEGNQTVILEVLSTGQILDTEQRLNSGYGSHYPGVSLEQQYILIPAANTTSQYYISPTGTVSRITTYEHLGRNGWSINYHPNRKMVIAATNSIYSVRNNGLLELANTYSLACDPRWINPRGNILVDFGINNLWVYLIDTVIFSLTTSQLFPIYGSGQEAVYTPDGNQLLVAKYPLTGVTEDVDIFQIASVGTVDTSAQHLDLVNTSGAKSIAMSSDGLYAFVMTDVTNGVIATLARNSIGQWYDTGKRVSNLNNPWLIRITPVYNLLVLQTFNESASERLLKTYYINSDGILTPTGYSFSITATVGDDDFVTFVFAYPPGVTAIDSDQWMLYR